MRSLILTILYCYFVSLGSGTLAVAFNKWFGSDDLIPFAIYCIPFSLSAAPIAIGLSYTTRRIPLSLAVVAAFGTGLLFGLLATLAVATFLGPWFGAMSVPILQAWCLAAAFVFATSVVVRRTTYSYSITTIAVLVLITGVTVFMIVGFRPALALATGDQHLTVYVFRHSAGDAELTVSGNSSSIDAADIKFLSQAGLRGTLQSYGSTARNTTDWPRAKAILILTQDLTADVSLPQPSHCTIAYLQEGDSFRRVPADAPTLTRGINLERSRNGWQLVIEQASGARSGGSAGF
jgi:hypothetical protein